MGPSRTQAGRCLYDRVFQPDVFSGNCLIINLHVKVLTINHSDS